MDKRISPKERKIKNLFFISAATIFLTLDTILAFFVISWSSIISLFLYVILSVFLYSFSLQLAKKIFSLFLKPYHLYKLRNGLVTKPKVAILYSTMNDVLPECLSIINQTYPCDVFVLDDSSLPEKREIVNIIAKEKGYKILRRSERKGFKAGAINNWINTYSKNYDYIVLLDSDSFLPKDWVEKTLEYAENPLNSKVAIFQGLINIWNLDNKFIRTLTALNRIGQDIWELKVANHLDAVFCYGHNVMIRMKPVLKIGGFVEGYTSEDFATAVKLAESGFKSRFVPLHTYEALPENIKGFIKRQHKWTRGSIEFLSFIRSKYLSFTQKILLFSIPLGHFSYIGILAAMFLTVFGYMTSFSSVYTFLYNLFYYNVFFILSIPIFRFALALQIITLTINFMKFKQLDISFYDSLKHEILSKAVGAIMLPYELKSMINYAINRKVQWPVTPKNEPRLNFKEILSVSKVTLVLSVVFILGLLFINPLGFLFNWGWLIPFALAPLTLYLYSNDKVVNSKIVYCDGGHFDNKISSNLSQDKEVYSFLRKVQFVNPINLGLSMGYKKFIFGVMLVSLASLAGLFLYNAATAYVVLQPPVQAPSSICGNGICELNENTTSCPQDCQITETPTLKGGIELVASSVIGPRSDPKQILYNDIVKLTTHVEKLGDANVSKVWCIVRFPSGNATTIELASNGVWSGTMKINETGTYSVIFNAVDESNTFADTVTINFKIILVSSSGILGGFAPSAGVPPTAY